jgi:hypothetical protein
MQDIEGLEPIPSATESQDSLVEEKKEEKETSFFDALNCPRMDDDDSTIMSRMAKAVNPKQPNPEKSKPLTYCIADVAIQSSRSSQDPPSAHAVEADKSFTQKRSLFDIANSQQTHTQQHKVDLSHSDHHIPHPSRQQSQRMPQRVPPSMASSGLTSEQFTGSGHLGARGVYDSTFQDVNQEIMLTKSMGGTLGATEFPSSPTDFSSHADSFFGKKDNAQFRQKNGMLGAIPLQHSSRGMQKKSSFGSAIRRAGLYDVFAPPGPIGIVVDTTKDGPAVHSLKPTSPMLGLISPGDLIVGLDDDDTRRMTAATLTRLMAKKANQRERKITLLASEAF